jgi:S1-C subfamily serine protease
MKDEIASGGTGVLIQRQGDTYTVITNQHVVSEPDRDYLIETHDGEQYAAQILATKASEQPEDVCFLTFQGQDRLYPILPLSTTSDPIALAQPVFAGGFPFTDDFVQSKEFRFTQGEVLRVLDRPFVGGYQLGYTNIIIPGMSGGPILNQKGELIGINALRSNPIFDNSYVYEDGTPVAPEELATIRRLSWGVPSTIAMRLLEPTPGNNKQVASPNPQPSITPAPKAVESCRK